MTTTSSPETSPQETPTMTPDEQASPDPGEPGEARAAVLARLGADLAALTTAISERLAATVPDLLAMTSADRGRFDAMVERLAALCLDVLASGRRLSAAEREVMVEAGRAAALQGLSAGAVRDAVHLAMSVGQDWLFGAWAAVSPGGEHQGLRAMAQSLRDLELDLLRAVEAGHAEDAATSRDRARQALVRSLLGGRTETAEIERQARPLGLDLAPPLHVVMFVDRTAAGDAPASFDERVAACARRLEGRAASPTVEAPARQRPELGVVLLTRAARRPWGRLAGPCQSLGQAAIHAPAPNLAEVAAAYRRLRAVAPIASRCADLLGSVVPLASVLPYRVGSALLLDEQVAVLREALGPLLASDRPDARVNLLDTLRAALDVEAVPNYSAVAHELGVTANTVRNRLRTVEEHTGMSVERDHFRFHLAVRLLDLWGPDLPPAGELWDSPAR